MPLPLTRSAIERLGKRLIAQKQPDDSDVDMLYQLLVFYGEQLSSAVDRVRTQTGYEPTTRLKTTGTIIDKLHRFGGGNLKSIQDLAGMRIVGNFDLKEQNEIAIKITEIFDHSPVKVIDRRLNPNHGYRALHLVVQVEGALIEIQIRTQWQHEWAELFEKMADKFGRGIRYGEPPATWHHSFRVELAESDPRMREISERLYVALYMVRYSNVGVALSLSPLIRIVEQMSLHGFHPDQLEASRRKVAEALADLRAELEDAAAAPPYRPADDKELSPEQIEQNSKYDRLIAAAIDSRSLGKLYTAPSDSE